MLKKFMEIKSWLKYVKVVVVKSGCGHWSQGSKAGYISRSN